MILVTVTEFRNNLSKYVELAFKEKVALKSKSGILELNPSKEIFVNPSPSGDPFWDDPRNVEELNRRLAEVDADLKSGKYKEYITWEQRKKEIGL